MNADKNAWDLMKNHLGYSDKEMEIFKTNPRNKDVISKAGELMQKTIVVEVVKSRGCNSRHKVGDKFYFDGAGNLLTKLGPDRVCIYALNSVCKLIYGANELFYAGVDPNELRFKRAGCFDVGVECGGWGHIDMEISVEDHKKKG